MRTKEFSRFLHQISKLTPTQQKQTKEKLQKKCNIQTIGNLLNKVDSCPHCNNKELYKWGVTANIQRYKCKSCNKTFNGLTNTPLSHLRHKDHWNEFAKDLVNGKSIRESAKHCHVDKSTTFRWRHRFLKIPSTIKAKHLHGIVEVDETYFHESHKGDKHLKRTSRKRGSPAKQRGLSFEQIPVLIVRDRNGNMSDKVLQHVNQQEVAEVMVPILDKDVLICSDGKRTYGAIANKYNFSHESIKASAKEYSRGAYHIQNVNAYDSRLKNWIRRFNGVATKYLNSYLGWMRMLDRESNLTSEKLLKLAASRVVVKNSDDYPHLMRT